MKICLVSTENLPTPPTGYWGGIESVVYDLACALVDLGHEVTLVARPESKSPGQLITTFPDVPDKLGNNERHFKCYRSYVSEFEGVVHDHSNGKMAHRIHFEVLNTMHWCQDPYAASYQNVSALCEAHAKWLAEKMPAGHEVEIVHHGIKAERFIYKEKKKDYYLFFSLMAAYKGTLDALNLAKETGVKMVFAGRDGNASDAVKSANKPNITYIGQVSNEQRAKLMSDAKALIFPTGSFGKTDWLEVFGFVQLEALASGTPVICSNNGACPEIIENDQTGFVCESYEEMKRALEEDWVKSIDPSECRHVTETRFSAETMAKNYIKLYEKILSGESW